MSYLCAVLAFLFAFLVLAQGAEVRIEPVPAAWSSR